MCEELKELREARDENGHDLKPCPFCGSKEIIFLKYKHAAGLGWKVFCCGCAAEIDAGWAQEPHVLISLWDGGTENET